jgi:hypothetical protein
MTKAMCARNTPAAPADACAYASSPGCTSRMSRRLHDAVVHRARVVAGHARAIVRHYVGVWRDVLDSKLRGACALPLQPRSLPVAA